MASSPVTRNTETISVQTMTNEELLTKHSEMIATVVRNPSARGAGPLLNVYRQEILRRMNHKNSAL